MHIINLRLVEVGLILCLVPCCWPSSPAGASVLLYSPGCSNLLGTLSKHHVQHCMLPLQLILSIIVKSLAESMMVEAEARECDIPFRNLQRIGMTPRDVVKVSACMFLCVVLQVAAWNKVALLQKVLKETPPERAPWILYMKPDTIIDDIAFTFPFEMYQGKDWVSVGDPNSAKQGWASGERLCLTSCSGINK
jgi:hypothetical protein